MCDRMMENAECQGLISETQFAYRKAKSTNDCLLDSITRTALSVNDNAAVDIVYTDFKFALETMPHDSLLSVLPQKGVFDEY